MVAKGRHPGGLGRNLKSHSNCGSQVTKVGSFATEVFSRRSTDGPVYRREFCLHGQNLFFKSMGRGELLQGDCWGGLSTDPGAVQHRGVRKERGGEEGSRRRTRLTGEPVVTVARPTRGRGWAPRSSWGDSAAALQ